MEGEAGDGSDTRAHEPLVELNGVQQRALQVVDADALVYRPAVGNGTTVSGEETS